MIDNLTSDVFGYVYMEDFVFRGFGSMVVSFNDVTILEVYEGVAKSGNHFGRIQFFCSETSEVFSVMLFGDELRALDGINSKEHFNVISFQIKPDRRGGVRLVPAW